MEIVIVAGSWELERRKVPNVSKDLIMIRLTGLYGPGHLEVGSSQSNLPLLRWVLSARPPTLPDVAQPPPPPPPPSQVVAAQPRPVSPHLHPVSSSFTVGPAPPMSPTPMAPGMDTCSPTPASSGAASFAAMMSPPKLGGGAGAGVGVAQTPPKTPGTAAAAAMAMAMTPGSTMTATPVGTPEESPSRENPVWAPGFGPQKWTCTFPCFGCLLTFASDSPTLCAGMNKLTEELAASAHGVGKSPGRGLCLRWDSEPCLKIPKENMFMVENPPFSGHNFSQMFRRFTGLRAHHELKVAKVSRWLILVFASDDDRLLWQDRYNERLQGHAMLPFLNWEKMYGAEWNLAPLDEPYVVWRSCLTKRETSGPAKRRGVMCPTVRFANGSVCLDHRPPRCRTGGAAKAKTTPRGARVTPARAPTARVRKMQLAAEAAGTGGTGASPDDVFDGVPPFSMKRQRAASKRVSRASARAVAAAAVADLEDEEEQQVKGRSRSGRPARRRRKSVKSLEGDAGTSLVAAAAGAVGVTEGDVQMPTLAPEVGFDAMAGAAAATFPLSPPNMMGTFGGAGAGSGAEPFFPASSVAPGATPMPAQLLPEPLAFDLDLDLSLVPSAPLAFTPSPLHKAMAAQAPPQSAGVPRPGAPKAGALPDMFHNPIESWMAPVPVIPQPDPFLNLTLSFDENGFDLN